MHPVKNVAEAKEKIIVPLDVTTAAEALHLVEMLASEVGWFKIGLQLFTRNGPEVVRLVRGTGARVFLDLKFHDIPNTVLHAVESAIALDVQMLTVHASGGHEMLAAAVRGAAGSATRVLGVTVLTSSNQQTLTETGVMRPIAEQVESLSQLAAAAGLGGLVASPLEVALLRAVVPREMKLVIPGIRPAGSDANDQKRIMTPPEAVAQGADYLVIGRPITAAADPVAAARVIVASLQG
ncbi:MAG TPA: orotidine-5'-phosphate decarboxylase [Chthoniobacterales bacterium]